MTLTHAITFLICGNKTFRKRNNHMEAKRKYMLWVVSFNLFNSVHMLAGWNTKCSENKLTIQLV